LAHASTTGKVWRDLTRALATLAAAAMLCPPQAATGTVLPASERDRPGVSHHEQCVATAGGGAIAIRGVAGEQLSNEAGAVLDVPEACHGTAGLLLQGIESISARGFPMYYAWPRSIVNSPGFVRAGELAGTVSVKAADAAGNGRPAPPAPGDPYYIVEPARIPGQQCYPGRARPNPSCRHGFLSFEPYGLPTGDDPSYTLMTWSWTDVAGGGIARAAVPAGARFFPADVEPIMTESYGPAGEADGSVTVRYGYVETGEGQVYGWMVASSVFEGAQAEGRQGCEDHMIYGGGGPPLAGTLCGASERTPLDGPVTGPNAFAPGTSGPLWEMVLNGGRAPSIRPAAPGSDQVDG
jgi:hypothetical protein